MSLNLDFAPITDGMVKFEADSLGKWAAVVRRQQNAYSSTMAYSTMVTPKLRAKRREIGRDRPGGAKFWFKATFSLAAGLAAIFAAGPLQASEGQWRLGAAAGGALWTADAYQIGPAVGLHTGYAVSDMFDVLLQGSLSRHSLDDDAAVAAEDDAAFMYSAVAGLSYKLDVIEWVPYAALMAGYYGVSQDPLGDSLRRHDFGIEIAVGLDYVLSRNWALGLQIDGSWLTAGAVRTSTLLRGEYRWGW